MFARLAFHHIGSSLMIASQRSCEYATAVQLREVEVSRSTNVTSPRSFRTLAMTFVRVIACFASLDISSKVARADDLPPPGMAGDPQISIDSSWSANTLGVRYGDAFATLSPFGSLYGSGIRFRLGGQWVGYNYLFSNDPPTLAWGDVLTGLFQVGYGINTRTVGAIALIGPSINENQNAGVRTTAIGMIGTLSISAKPTETTLVYGSAQYSTVNNGYQASAKVGFQAFDASYIGVEGRVAGLVVRSEALLTQRSLGAHLSNIKLGPTYLGVSGGYVFDAQLGGGAYLTSSIYVAF